jgi:hypothetical protein
MAVEYYFFCFLEWYDPVDGIEVVEDNWDQGNFEDVSTVRVSGT